MPIYSPYYPIDRGTARDVRRYVSERFREAGWCDKNQPYAPIDITVDTFPDAYHVIVRVPVSRKEIPDEMLQLAIEVEEELESRGYPTGVIVRPTISPVTAT
jgi:hypothetical protein